MYFLSADLAQTKRSYPKLYLPSPTHLCRCQEWCPAAAI